MSRNNKKLVLITGVTRGLGLAMAEKFFSLGHRVVGCGRSKSAIEKLHGTYAKPHDFTSVDVADDDQVHAWAERLLKIGRLIFGVCLIVFGLAHLVYLRPPQSLSPHGSRRDRHSGLMPRRRDILRPASRFSQASSRAQRPCG